LGPLPHACHVIKSSCVAGPSSTYSPPFHPEMLSSITESTDPDMMLLLDEQDLLLDTYIKQVPLDDNVSQPQPCGTGEQVINQSAGGHDKGLSTLRSDSSTQHTCVLCLVLVLVLMLVLWLMRRRRNRMEKKRLRARSQIVRWHWQGVEVIRYTNRLRVRTVDSLVDRLAAPCVHSTRDWI
jgi:hypothetical protein